LFLRFGLLGDAIGRTSWLIDPQEDSVARGQSWLALAIGIFILLIMLYISPHLVSSLQQGEDLETYILDQKLPSLGTFCLNLLYTPFALLYSPIALLLTIEAWLILLSYFSLHYLLHRLKVPTDQIQSLKTAGMTMLQFLGILTCLIGFGWLSNLNSIRYEAINNFSLVVLSPATVLLTFGLVFILFTSLNKILAVEENTEQHQQIARRMTFVLFSTLILLGLVGGSLSFLIHYTREPWPSIGP
jgi:hypothetical protein